MESPQPIATDKSETPKNKRNGYLPWWWPFVIFGLVALAYITMDLQGITTNEHTRTWAIGISGVGAAIAAASLLIE